MSCLTQFLPGLPLPSNIAYLCRLGRVFFAPQVDFNSFSWHTLFLLGGGNVLGKAIASSQLLDYLAHCIVPLLPEVCTFYGRPSPPPPRILQKSCLVGTAGCLADLTVVRAVASRPVKGWWCTREGQCALV